VTRGNYAAIAMYRNSGFTLKNEHQPLPSDPCRDEVRMVLEVPRSSAG
jgi:ribosomal protein S18 acetylase RimI-like enzyme